MLKVLTTLVIGLLFVILPVFVVFRIIQLLRINQRRSREKKIIPQNWRSAKGRITAASVEEAVRTRVEEDAFYYPQVRFEYSDGNNVYEEAQAVGRPYNNTFMARRTLKGYPAGGEVTVFYNPDKPDESMLPLT